MADAAAIEPKTTNGTEPVVAEDWRATLPDDLKSDKTLERYKSVADLAKSRVEAEKLIGSSIRLPGKDAKPEEITKAKTDTMAKLRAAGLVDGAPESPDKYDVTLPDWAAVDGTWNQEDQKAFLGEMHKTGASQAVVNAALSFYTGLIERQAVAERQHRVEVQAELQKEWGPNYKPNVGIANKAVQKLDDEIGAKGEFIGLLQTFGLADHPLMVKGMAWLGRSMWEHDMITAVGGTVGAEEAQARMDAMMKDKTHALNNPRHPDYALAVDEFLALQRTVTGGRR